MEKVILWLSHSSSLTLTGVREQVFRSSQQSGVGDISSSCESDMCSSFAFFHLILKRLLKNTVAFVLHLENV